MKKRSLFAATAMLLVALLVATGTTYAWFTSTPKATAEIQMGVATGSSLEISATADSGYKSYLNAAELGIDTGDIWSDYSTNTTDFANGTFYTDQYDSTTGLLSGYEEGTPCKVTIYFRSTSAEGVILTTGTGITKVDTTKQTIQDNARVGIISNGAGTTKVATILANGAAATEDETITGTALTANAGTYDYVSLGSYSTAVVSLNPTVAADGFYYGQADIYFWLEGPNVSNGDLSASDALTTKFVFTQASLAAAG